MYNPTTRRDFLRGVVSSPAIAVAGHLSDRVSTTVGTLGGLVGVMATPASGSAKDLTPQQMAEYAAWFFEIIQDENKYREARPHLKGPRCNPTKAVLFDGAMEGESVTIEVKKNDKYLRRWCCRSPPEEFTLEMSIVPKNGPIVTDFYLESWLGSRSGSTFTDKGLKINLLHPEAEVSATDVEKMESVRWVRGGYDINKYYAPEGGCLTEVGRIRYCFEADALYDTSGFRGEEVRNKPHFSGEHYKRIGHNNLMRRREAELQKANVKYIKHLKFAIQRKIQSDEARLKKSGTCIWGE